MFPSWRQNATANAQLDDAGVAVLGKYSSLQYVSNTYPRSVLLYTMLKSF